MRWRRRQEMKPVRHPSIEWASISFLTWTLLIAVLFLGVGEIYGGMYLRHRQETADQRAERQRVALCNILDQFPPGANPQLDNARAVFACTFAERAPSPAPTTASRTPAPKRHPRPRVTVTAPPQVITRPGPPRLVVTPGPTVTITKHPHPKPRPRPTPACSSLRVNGMCIKLPAPTRLPGPLL